MSETLEIARRCRFSVDELRYEYREELVPAGETPAKPPPFPDPCRYGQTLLTKMFMRIV